MSNRTRGTIAIEIPRSALKALIAEKAGIEAKEVRPEQTFLLDRGEGLYPRYAIVNTEGVGQVEPDEGAPFQVYTETLDGYYLAPADKLVAAASEGWPHDLADVIRTFGARLESNFHLWQEWATA